MEVAIIGLGIMGRHVAGRLLDTGHQVRVYNRTPGPTDALRERGALAAASPRQAAEGAAIAITLVSDDRALRSVAEGPDGLLAGLCPGSIVLQMGTVSPRAAERLAAAVGEHGAVLLDAPVMGSSPEAREGRLWVLAGGDANTIARARPVLDAIAQRVYEVGAVGQGSRLKLCLNILGGGMVAALAEGMALIDAARLDPHLYIRVLQDADLPRRVMLGKADLMVRRDFAPRFSLDHMSKDVGLAIDMAQTYGLSLDQAQATRETLRRGALTVGGDRDVAAAVLGVHRHVAAPDAVRTPAQGDARLLSGASIGSHSPAREH